MASRGKSNTATDRSLDYSQAHLVISKWFAGATRTVERGAQLQADDIARLLCSLHPGYFRAATRTRYYCNYAPQDEMEEFTVSRAFETLDAARIHAQVLVQQGFGGRIEKHYEWRNLVCGRSWHIDAYDPDAIEIVEDFPEAS
jgi:hypothetical protein